jgi:hypothetical protein
MLAHWRIHAFMRRRTRFLFCINFSKLRLKPPFGSMRHWANLHWAAH